MLKNIPIPANHYIDGYEEVKVVNPNNFFASSIITYKPVYKRSIEFGTIVTTETTPYLLVDDTHGLNAMNELEEIKNYKIATDEQVIEFLNKIHNNGFKLSHGGTSLERKEEMYYHPYYTVDCGFMPKSITKESPSWNTFEGWQEIFDTKEDCINWCNAMNEFMRRNYPKQ